MIMGLQGQDALCDPQVTFLDSAAVLLMLKHYNIKATTSMHKSPKVIAAKEFSHDAVTANVILWLHVSPDSVPVRCRYSCAD